MLSKEFIANSIIPFPKILIFIYVIFLCFSGASIGLMFKYGKKPAGIVLVVGLLITLIISEKLKAKLTRRLVLLESSVILEVPVIRRFLPIDKKVIELEYKNILFVDELDNKGIDISTSNGHYYFMNPFDTATNSKILSELRSRCTEIA